MIKQEIIEKICKYFKLTSFEAEKIYDDIFAGIIQGVKEDNIADITNLGEFIIKYNSTDSDNKKTVEFLPTLSLEEEINARSFEEQRQFVPADYVSPEEPAKPPEDKINQFEEKDNNTLNTGETVITTGRFEDIPPLKEINMSEPVIFSDQNNLEHINTDQEHTVEEDIKRKREEILSKITNPKSVSANLDVPPVIIPPVEIPAVENPEKVEASLGSTFEDNKQNIIASNDRIEEQKTEILDKNEKTTENTPKEVEEVTEKSFSDYFTEISKEDHSFSGQVHNSINTPPPPPVNESTVIPPVENVIPPGAVELHKELTGDNSKTNEYQTTINPMPFANGNGNGNGNVDKFEHRLQDNSYYIWYKDSEPNTTDTQTMSYEYELLYQATKEAEYKSKLRIYVTTFIMFFSIVLILLIFSPVIYKYFFTPKEDQKTEEVQQETSTTEEPSANTQNNQASVNSLENQPPVTNNTQQNTTQEQPKQENKQPVQEPVKEQPKQEQPKQEQSTQEQPKTKNEQPVQQNTTQSIPGVTKSSMGWIDDNNKVIYIQLDNGKFTIQESAWDSDSKANKRISSVGAIVPGLKGNVIKVDLGSKGTWYRARFGEFTTIEEAQKKAGELRSKEKNRLQALLLTFLLFT